ncbi:hypothetical protein [Saccharothrix sp.]|uniref:hypothetical protein n=1 Tax=Saccharothrix sp. TaxID=1873460 RepID=UPI002810ECFC|nr:hypothetical protein [Saccharothrix sp.]
MNRRVVGVVALVAAAPLAVVATFLPLYEQVWRFNLGDRMDLRHTSWAVHTSNGSVFGREALYGVPVVAAVALLVVGAVFVRAMWGRLVAFGGALMLVGAAWAVGQLALATWRAGQPVVEGLTIDTEAGLAVPVYGVACVLAVAGGLLVQEWPVRGVEPAGAVVYRVDEDDRTPPFGLALPPAPDAIVPPGYDSAGHGGLGSGSSGHDDPGGAAYSGGLGGSAGSGGASGFGGSAGLGGVGGSGGLGDGGSGGSGGAGGVKGER